MPTHVQTGRNGPNKSDPNKKSEPNKEDVERHVGELPALSTPELRALWQELFNRPAPKFRREIMIPILGYRLREKAYGGLKASTRNRLRKIAAMLEKNPKADLGLGPKIKPGTRLLRDWGGETHEVLVLESGYEYRSKRFDSLSEIARHITGSRWSGPLFFGLRAAKQQKKQGAAPRG